jgi:hypothetical protein
MMIDSYQLSIITHQLYLRPYKCDTGFAFVMKFTDKTGISW